MTAKCFLYVSNIHTTKLLLISFINFTAEIIVLDFDFSEV